MTEEAISTIQEDIAMDLPEIAACHQEEVNRLMQEFDKHDIDTTVQFEAYEAERQRQTPGLSAPNDKDKLHVRYIRRRRRRGPRRRCTGG